MKRRIITVLLLLALAFGITGGPVFTEDSRHFASAATATPQTDEYANNSLIQYFNQTLNEQLIACLSGSDGVRARIQKSNREPYKSEITFYLDPFRLSRMTVEEVLDYVSEAICENPNLCMLSTNITYASYTGEISVFSLVEKDKYASAIRGYKSFLADLERIPRAATQMSDAAILLYLHDRLIQQAKYAEGSKDNLIYIPLTMAETGVVVCQSYAAVMNQLMRDLGFTGYVLESESHAWNAVKLNGLWNQLDPTWDDPVVGDSGKRDFVSHKFLLVKPNVFSYGHDLADYSSNLFPGIDSNPGETALLPKTENIEVPMCFDGKNWFYASNGMVYRWDGVSARATVENAIPRNADRCVGEISGEIYIGGSDGLYLYKPDQQELIPYDTNLSVRGLLYYKKGLYYRGDNDWTLFQKVEEPYTTYESLNGSDNLEVIELPVPQAPTILAKKSSARSLRVTVTKPASGANKGYEIEIARNASFTSGKKTKTITGTTASFAGLEKKKTYYVRVRGIWNDPVKIYKKNGKWSSKKRVKL